MKRYSLCWVIFPMIMMSVSPTSAFEVLGEVELQPMEKPSPLPIVTGTELHWLRDGKEAVTYYESVDAEITKARYSDGCSWATKTYGFSPATKWDNCSGSSGTQKITKTKGSPWPMTEKTKFQYSFRGKRADGGKPWTSTRKCKVKGQERVKVPAGEFDTYKVECKDKWNKRTYWISPALGHGVAFKRKHESDPSRSYMMELVKVVKQ